LKSLLGISFLPRAVAASDKQFKQSENVFSFGAKGDGKSDDTRAFKEWFARHDSLNLPQGKCFILGELELEGKSLIGPGVIKIKTGAKSALTLKGISSRIININFIGQGTGRRPEAEVLLAPGLTHAIIEGCTFSGELFNAIGCGVNSEKDKSLNLDDIRANIAVINNQFKGRYSHHLYLHQANNLIITNNFFENSSHDSIRLRQLVKSTTISQNHFKNIGISKDTDSKDAVDCFWSGHQLIISDNHFENIAVNGIDLKGHSPDLDYGSSRVTISGNHFRQVGFSGILISSGEKSAGEWKAIRNVSVVNNHFESCGHASSNANDAALFMRHNQEMVIVNSNQFYGNFNKGIMVGNFAAGAPVSKNILIQNNLFSNNGQSKNLERYGIHVLGGSGVIIQGNIITNEGNHSSFRHNKGIVVEKYNLYPATEIINKDNLVKIT
jgi:hypothetical protein